MTDTTDTTGDGRYEAGLRVRREVLGDEHVERALAGAGADADFQRFLTELAWGGVWTRDDRLDRRTRSCVTIAVLTALRAEAELALHVAGARRNGLTDDEIMEVIMHTAVYAGVPAANAAMGVARRVLDA